MDLTTVAQVVVPGDRDELRALGVGAGDAYLAGGSWVYSEPQVGVTRLIDLAGLGWPPLTFTADGLEIAATCTLAELATVGRGLGPSWPALALARGCCDALRGSFKVWNVATVGGNLACALAAAPMTSFTAALDGVALLWAPDGGERRLPIVDLITGDGTTALGSGEVIRSITLPASALASATAFRQGSLTNLGRSAALLIGRLEPATGAFVLTITASVPRPVQLRFDALPTADELAAALADRLPSEAHYFDDVHGRPAWRRRLTEVFAEEIRAELAERSSAASDDEGFASNGTSPR